MPFITEELWHAVYDGDPPAKSIALTQYPTAAKLQAVQGGVTNLMTLTLQPLIEGIRGLRKMVGVPEREPTPVEIRCDLGLIRESINNNQVVVQRLARVTEIRFVSQISSTLNAYSTGTFDVAVVYEKQIDVAAERERLTKDIAKYEKGLAAAERQLSNEAFLKKAPPQVVEGLKKQEAETRLLLEKAKVALDALPNE